MGKYNTLLQILASSVMLSLLLACNENGDRSPNGELQNVYEVTAAHLNVLESLPLQLKINADGDTRTGGWSNPQLIPYEYVAPPADGIFEFDFKAQPPAGTATQAITPIKTSYTIDPLIDNLKGVKIYAEQNNMVAMLETNDLVCGGIQGKKCEDEQQYCDFGIGQCKVADAEGTCKDKPKICTKDYRPVCGCDGKTYGNACTAAAAGISIDHPGECTPTAFFEFKGFDDQDRFVIKLVDPEDIHHARDLLAGNTSKRPSVMGTIIKSKENYNPNWSYHLTPESISFFDVAIEVCDANMRYVEEHLDEVGGAFLPGNQWCPWSSQLTKEIDLQ